jgi:hypothetical protein
VTGLGARVPPYGRRTLAEVVPSILSAVGLDGFPNALDVEPVERACLLVIDGLGWELVRDHGESAPFLSSLLAHSPPISAVFPSTTASALASLGTGLPPGEHGFVGYVFAMPGHERPMNGLRWELYGVGPYVDLAGEFPPESVQPHATLMERAEAAGLEMTVVGPAEHDGSPLTRAILRGGRYVGANGVDELVGAAARALRPGYRAVAYAYYPWLDTAGHLHGVGSERWLEQLETVGRIVEAVAGSVPPGSAVFVTADHGMVNLSPEERIDVIEEPSLLHGVRFLGGEARARHVYVRDGALDDVLSAWRAVVGRSMIVVPGEEAVEEGWFGPRVEDRVRPRIGDAVAVAIDRTGVFQREVDPLQAMLRAHHGALSEAELRVPLLQVRT